MRIASLVPGIILTAIGIGDCLRDRASNATSAAGGTSAAVTSSAPSVTDADIRRIVADELAKRHDELRGADGPAGPQGPPGPAGDAGAGGDTRPIRVVLVNDAGETIDTVIAAPGGTVRVRGSRLARTRGAEATRDGEK